MIEDDNRYFAEHSVSGLLRGDHASRSAYYVSALTHGWMTVNEVRELENLNPIGPEGDQHFVQLNMTTLEKAASESEPQPEPPLPLIAEEPAPEPPAADNTPQDQEQETDGT